MHHAGRPNHLRRGRWPASRHDGLPGPPARSEARQPVRGAARRGITERQPAQQAQALLTRRPCRRRRLNFRRAPLSFDSLPRLCGCAHWRCPRSLCCSIPFSNIQTIMPVPLSPSANLRASAACMTRRLRRRSHIGDAARRLLPTPPRSRPEPTCSPGLPPPPWPPPLSLHTPNAFHSPLRAYAPPPPPPPPRAYLPCHPLPSALLTHTRPQPDPTPPTALHTLLHSPERHCAPAPPDQPSEDHHARTCPLFVPCPHRPRSPLLAPIPPMLH